MKGWTRESINRESKRCGEDVPNMPLYVLGSVPCIEDLSEKRIPLQSIPSSRAPQMRTRCHQRPNRSEGPCVIPKWDQRLSKHKVPPAYSVLALLPSGCRFLKDQEISEFSPSLLNLRRLFQLNPFRREIEPGNAKAANLAFAGLRLGPPAFGAALPARLQHGAKRRQIRLRCGLRGAC